MKCMQKMNVITKISCYFERSVVTLKLRKDYLNIVTYNTPVLLWIKYWTVWHMEHYSMSTYMGVTNFQKTVRFLAHPVDCPWPSLWMTLKGYRSRSESFYLKYLETVTDTMLDRREDFFESSHALSIGTVRFDLGWPWEVKNQGHIFDVKYVKNCKNYDVGSMCFTLDDLERLKVKVKNGPVTAIGMWRYERFESHCMLSVKLAMTRQHACLVNEVQR